jgi:hypothetical protein
MRLGNVTKLMQSNETFHYQGKGVKLGEKDTAVLWYKPKGKDKYVVMFGDLHVKRMLKKDLPPKRKNVPAKPAPGKAGAEALKQIQAGKPTTQPVNIAGTYREVLRVKEPIVATLGRTAFPASARRQR